MVLRFDDVFKGKETSVDELPTLAGTYANMILCLNNSPSSSLATSSDRRGRRTEHSDTITLRFYVVLKNSLIWLTGASFLGITNTTALDLSEVIKWAPTSGRVTQIYS